MEDFGLIVMLKYRATPMGVTFTDIYQQCISLLMDMVKVCSCLVLKS